MKEMSLVDHLTDLRKTVVRVAIILIIAFGISYSYSDTIQEVLLMPLRNALDKLPGGGEVVFLEVLDKVLAQFQVALYSAIILSSPLWFREIWSFVRPGLYNHEVKMVRPFIVVGFLLFVAGVSFGYFIVFPLTFEILLNFGVSDVTASMSLKGYLVLSSKVLVFMGILFQLPNVMLILGFMGLVTKYSLREMRRYVYVVFSIMSALLTPPDPATMLGIWIPLVVLYELGILGVALFVHPWLHKKTAENEMEVKQSQASKDAVDTD